MKITFDSHEDADKFQAALAIASGGTPIATATAAVAKAAPAKAATPTPEPTPEPEPEPEPADEDLLGGDEPDPTVQDALTVASGKVQDGKAPDVKKILVELGVKKVSELDGNVEGLKTFIAKASAL